MIAERAMYGWVELGHADFHLCDIPPARVMRSVSGWAHRRFFSVGIYCTVATDEDVIEPFGMWVWCIPRHFYHGGFGSILCFLVRLLPSPCIENIVTRRAVDFEIESGGGDGSSSPLLGCYPYGSKR